MTEESLIDRLNTDMHEACLKIEKDCRSEQMNKFYHYLHLVFLFEIMFLCLNIGPLITNIP